MKEADLFRQYAHEAACSSSKATSQAEKDALMALACTCLKRRCERKSARLELREGRTNSAPFPSGFQEIDPRPRFQKLEANPPRPRT